MKEKITFLAIPKIMTDFNYEIVRSMLLYIFIGTYIKVKPFTDYKISDKVKKSINHGTAFNLHRRTPRGV